MSFMSSLSKVVSNMSILVKMLPSIIDAVKTVEAQYSSESGKGSQKLEMVRVVLETAYSFAEEMPTQFAEIWPMINKTISGIVGIFNTTGWIK